MEVPARLVPDDEAATQQASRWPEHHCQSTTSYRAQFNLLVHEEGHVYLQVNYA